MAAWPEPAELAQIVDITNVDDWQTTLDRLMAAAIRKVKSDVGLWDDNVDEPDANLAQAALRMAELMALRPQIAAGIGARSSAGASISADPAYQALIQGHRRQFGVG